MPPALAILWVPGGWSRIIGPCLNGQMRDMIINALRYGQLGNRLLVYAHLIAAAREYGVTLLNPAMCEYAHLFPAIADDVWCRYPPAGAVLKRPSLLTRVCLTQTISRITKLLWAVGLKRYPCGVLRIRYPEQCDLMDATFARLARAKPPLLVSGWEFRSDLLLQKHADQVRTHLQIDSCRRAAIHRLLTTSRESSDVVVGVHIRQGDYAEWEAGRYYYSTHDYYQTMRNIVEQLPGRRVSFLVCSDSHPEPTEFSDLQVHWGSGHIVEDLYGLAETDLVVGPPSTYSGWAAFYGQKPLAILQKPGDVVDVGLLNC